jgi:uncharacterized spore protein YtfJ
MNAKDLLGKIGTNLSVGRSFGTAYEKDGLYIIPVALVAGGGGGGEGATPTTDETETLDDTSEGSVVGSGAGFGGVVLPVGAYVVNDGDVKWVPAVNVTLIVLAGLGVLRLLIRTSAKTLRHHHR